MDGAFCVFVQTRRAPVIYLFIRLLRFVVVARQGRFDAKEVHILKYCIKPRKSVKLALALPCHYD
jgi:hypothetical protein